MRCTSGICTAGVTCRRWISGRSTRWCSSFVRRMIRPKPTASSGVVTSLNDLSASIWTWFRDGQQRTAPGVRKMIDIPPSLPTPTSAAPAQGLRCGAAAGHRHQPVARRPVPLCLVLGYRRAEAVRRLRSLQPGRDRLGEDRRHRPAAAAPARPASRSTAHRRWSRSAATASASMSRTRCTHLGRAVLSRRHPRLAGEGGRAARTAA